MHPKDTIAEPTIRLAVIIATLGRRALLAKILEILDDQTRPPDEVIVSAPDASHVAPFTPKHFTLTCVYGPKGLCSQRNRALQSVRDRADIVTFFDDDFVPSRSYLEGLIATFEQNPHWAVINGALVADGAKSATGYSFETGLAMLRAAELSRAEAELSRISFNPGAYGCNMSLRTAHIGDIRFDERLPLYGWQEDIDFTSQLGRHGDIVSVGWLLGVHLAEKSGRVSGVKFGYSQVSNPIYLIRKGTMPAAFGLKLMLRNLAANLVKSVWPERLVDRRGRLRGNILALAHLMRGRVEPEYILKL